MCAHVFQRPVVRKSNPVSMSGGRRIRAADAVLRPRRRPETTKTTKCFRASGENDKRWHANNLRSFRDLSVHENCCFLLSSELVPSVMAQTGACHAEIELLDQARRPFVDSGADHVRLSEAVGATMGGADSELVRRWMRGEEAAFADIVRRWEQPLARFLGRLADANQVPDLLQETFLRVHRARVRYSENGHFSTWLFQIALNVARDTGRRRTPPECLTDEPIAAAPSAAQSLEQREEIESLSRAVAELPDEMREVLALRHDAGLSFEEMARRLNVPASTLKSRFAAALRRLRKHLKEPGESPEGSP